MKRAKKFAIAGLVATTTAFWLSHFVVPADAQDANTQDGASPDGSSRYAGFLQRIDRNSDGVIEPGEVPAYVRPYVERMASRANLDPQKPMKIKELLAPASQKATSGQAQGNFGNSKDSSKSRKSNSGKSESTVPDFGETDETKPVPDFDVRLGFVPLEQRYSSSVIKYVEGVMRRYDRDKNDILDPEEMKRVNWVSDPKPSDLNGDGSISKAEMCERIKRRWEREREKRSDSSNSRNSDRSSDSGKSSSGSSGSESGSKIRRYAQSLLRQYDKNKNGVLERDEFKHMRGDTAKADANNDGVITLDELVVRLDKYSRGGSYTSTSKSPPTNPSTKSKYTSNRNSSGNKPNDKVYRVTSPLERLPRGLPSWFTRNDANEDGQIAMSEYTTSWSDSKVGEFAKYDLNRDGVITPTEYLDATKKPD